MSESSSVKKRYIRWAPVLWFIHIHFISLLGIWLVFTTAKWMTILFTILLVTISGLGVTVGAHRLWAHRTFQASGSLKLFLIIAHTLAGVGTIYDWVLAHRIHHKYYGTDQDPYNHKKGFLYSHFFSNLLSNHPDYENLKTSIDMRDIEGDAYVMGQKAFYWILFPVVTLLLPLNAPLEYWDESMTASLCIVGFLRCAITANTAWLVNSAALIWTAKTEEKLMSISDSIALLYKLFFKMPKSHGTVVIDNTGVHSKVPDISIFFVDKSFWPNYHYVVPWDWKSDEFGHYGSGCATLFIKIACELGYIDELQTLKSDDIKEALYKVAAKQLSFKSALDNLKILSEEHAKKAKLLCRN